MTEIVIQLDHVRKSFGDFVAVEHADFGIRQRAFFMHDLLFFHYSTSM